MVILCHKGTAPSRWAQPQRLFLKAIALQRRQTLAPSTVGNTANDCVAYWGRFKISKPKEVEGQRLLKRYQKIREHLLLFLTDETIPPTNNSSEQGLPGVSSFAR